MPNETITKAAVTAGGMILISCLGNIIHQVLGLLIALAALAVLDYITGVGNAWKDGRLSSKIGLIGIIKKLGYAAVVVLSMALDYLITFSVEKTGVSGFTSIYLTAIVVLWLCANEGISILENLSGIGVPFPKFMTAAFSKIKAKTEQAGEDKNKENNEK